MHRLGNLPIRRYPFSRAVRLPIALRNLPERRFHRTVLVRRDRELPPPLPAIVHHPCLIEGAVAAHIDLLPRRQLRRAAFQKLHRLRSRRLIAGPKLVVHADSLHVPQQGLIAFHLGVVHSASCFSASMIVASTSSVSSADAASKVLATNSRFNCPSACTPRLPIRRSQSPKASAEGSWSSPSRRKTSCSALNSRTSSSRRPPACSIHTSGFT